MEPSGCPTRCRIASTVKISSAVIWMALIVKFVTRRGLDSAVRDVSDPESRDNCYQRHEDRTGSPGIDNAREEDANDVANHDTDGGGHRPRVDPVIEMRTATEDEFGHSREAKVSRMVEKGLLGEQIGAAGAWVQFIQLRV